MLLNEVMSGKTGLIVAALVSPAIGVLALLHSINPELVLRPYQEIRTQEFRDSGITEWLPMVSLCYALFCWAVILPTVYQTREASMKMFRNPFSLSLIMAAITCFIAFLAVYEPAIESWYGTLFELGASYGKIVFLSSLSASILIRTQQDAAGQPGIDRELT